MLSIKPPRIIIKIVEFDNLFMQKLNNKIIDVTVVINEKMDNYNCFVGQKI